MSAPVILGLIPARGGSKRVPGKNVRDFHGKPLIAWTVEAGKEAGVFDDFILATDDAAIKEAGETAGIRAPFLLPAELTTDTAKVFGAVKYALEWMKEHEQTDPDWIILLEATTPGKQAQHIKDVAALCATTAADSIIGVSELPAHFSPHKVLARDEQGTVTRLSDGEILRNLTHRNQDVPKSYFINSLIYAFRAKNLYDGNDSLWGDSTHGYLIDEKYAFDIDTEEDWKLAEYKMDFLTGIR